MTNMLNDKNTYLKIDKDPTKKIIHDLHSFLTRWKNKEYISDTQYRSLNCTDNILPKAYELPKIDKPDCPLRIIISSVDTFLYCLAKFLHNIMYKSLPKANSFIDNSFHLVDKLRGLCLEENYKLISLDVISLFTNVPAELAIDGIEKRWNFIKLNCKIPKNKFLIVVRFVLNSTFFTFNHVCYQQTFGTLMGFPLSPVLADITLQDLEARAVAPLPIILLFYIRYVDDNRVGGPLLIIYNSITSFQFYPFRTKVYNEGGIR